MLGEGGFTHQPPPPKPPSPTGGNNNETQPDFADINLLPTKNGLDFGVHLPQARINRESKAAIREEQACRTTFIRLNEALKQFNSYAPPNERMDRLPLDLPTIRTLDRIFGYEVVEVPAQSISVESVASHVNAPPPGGPSVVTESHNQVSPGTPPVSHGPTIPAAGPSQRENNPVPEASDYWETVVERQVRSSEGEARP